MSCPRYPPRTPIQWERVRVCWTACSRSCAQWSAGLCPRERKLLSLLVSGSTDTVAAAAIGVSVRTVRRMVRDLMNRLGARSRFQAGAKAAERGWLAGG